MLPDYHNLNPKEAGYVVIAYLALLVLLAEAPLYLVAGLQEYFPALARSAWALPITIAIGFSWVFLPLGMIYVWFRFVVPFVNSRRTK